MIPSLGAATAGTHPDKLMLTKHSLINTLRYYVILILLERVWIYLKIDTNQLILAQGFNEISQIESEEMSGHVTAPTYSWPHLMAHGHLF